MELIRKTPSVWFRLQLKDSRNIKETRLTQQSFTKSRLHIRSNNSHPILHFSQKFNHMLYYSSQTSSDPFATEHEEITSKPQKSHMKKTVTNKCSRYRNYLSSSNDNLSRDRQKLNHILLRARDHRFLVRGIKIHPQKHCKKPAIKVREMGLSKVDDDNGTQSKCWRRERVRVCDCFHRREAMNQIKIKIQRERGISRKGDDGIGIRDEQNLVSGRG